MSQTTLLLDAARAGDREALTTLLARHEGRLLGCIRALLPAGLALRVAPEDLLQETLLEASRKLPGFVPEHGSASFYRWLVAIARFKVLEAGRAQRAAKRAREEPLEASVPAGWTSPSGGALRSERAAALAQALARLPERQAAAVRLRWLEGRSVAETAAELEASEPAVKALVSRGLAALAQELGA